MKINDLNRIGATNPYRNHAASIAETSRRKGPSKDELHISEQAKELHGAELHQSGRIEQIKQAVQSGTYHVEANKIAEKLLPYLR